MALEGNKHLMLDIFKVQLQFIMAFVLIILNSLTIVMFSLFYALLDFTSLKLSVAWNIFTCKELSTGKIEVA